MRRDGPPRRNQPVYLDHQSTTPVDPRVMQAMLPYFTEFFGSPDGTAHGFGREAAAAVEAARAKLAGAIGADPREIVFTSGATEANNLAILGAGRFRRDNRDRRSRVVTVATEHVSVLESCAALGREGIEVTVLPVGTGGLVDLELLRAAVTDRTALVSVMAANNEIGVLQPLAEIGRICSARGAWFHTDAAQAAGKIPLDVEAMRIDLLSVSGHKLYGPKGIGALYVRRRPRVRLEPLLQGGGQERGLRAGTPPVPLCVGLGAAAEIAVAEMAEEGARLRMLHERFLERLRLAVPDFRINGDAERRLPGSLNLAFPGVAAEALVAELDGTVAISAGPACGPDPSAPSHVLRALGIDEMTAAASVRIGFGRFTSEPETDAAADAVAAAVRAIRGCGRTAAPQFGYGERGSPARDPAL